MFKLQLIQPTQLNINYKTIFPTSNENIKIVNISNKNIEINENIFKIDNGGFPQVFDIKDENNDFLNQLLIIKNKLVDSQNFFSINYTFYYTDINGIDLTYSKKEFHFGKCLIINSKNDIVINLIKKQVSFYLKDEDNNNNEWLSYISSTVTHMDIDIEYFTTEKIKLLPLPSRFVDGTLELLDHGQGSLIKKPNWWWWW